LENGMAATEVNKTIEELLSLPVTAEYSIPLKRHLDEKQKKNNNNHYQQQKLNQQ
jgi:hypothetical protein